MIGTNERPWSFLHSALVPTALVATEATWASLLIGALVTSGGVHRDVPFLALGVPAVLAALSSAFGARRIPNRLQRALGLAMPLVLLWLVAAGLFGGLILHDAVLAVIHPWTLSGEALTGSTLALVAVGLAVARGAWLGRDEPSLSSVLASVGSGAFVYLVLLCLAALPRDQVFARELARNSAVLLMVAFPLAFASVGLVRERELERASLKRVVFRPSMAWMLAIGAPMAAIAGIALLGVFVLASLVPPVGHLLVDAARGLGALLAALVGLIGRTFSFKVSPRSGQRVVPHLPALPPLRSGTAHLPGWFLVVGATVGALLVLAGILLAARLWRRRPPRVRSRARARWTPRPPSEIRDSLFSFSHLLDQIRQALARLTARAVRVRGEKSGAPRAEGVVTEPESVRHQYRRLLRQARLAGHGRQLDETPLELAARLRLSMQEPDLPTLEPLTELYDTIRYGDTAEEPADAARARDLVEVLLVALPAGQPTPQGEADRQSANQDGNARLEPSG